MEDKHIVVILVSEGCPTETGVIHLRMETSSPNLVAELEEILSDITYQSLGGHFHVEEFVETAGGDDEVDSFAISFGIDFTVENEECSLGDLNDVGHLKLILARPMDVLVFFGDIDDSIFNDEGFGDLFGEVNFGDCLSFDVRLALNSQRGEGVDSCEH